MTSITQTINSYIGGISQQPDEKKVPGQLITAKNVLPDVTEGLMKRPGSQLISSLSDGTLNSDTNGNGKWFHYYRDENEQYVGQINRLGIVRMWDCATGSEKTVTNNLTVTSNSAAYARNTSGVITVTLPNHGFTQVGEIVNLDFTSGTAVDDVYSITGVTSTSVFTVKDSTTAATSGNVTVKKNYLYHLKDADLQTLTLNDYTYITNRNTITKMKALDTTSPNVYDGTSNKNPIRQPEAFVELKKVAYASQYALNIYDDENAFDTLTTATRIKIEKTDTNETDTCPHVDTQIFNVTGFWTIDGTSYSASQLDNISGFTATPTAHNGNAAYCSYARNSSGVVTCNYRDGTNYAGTYVDHNLAVGDKVTAEFITGGANNGTFTVTEITDSKIFKFNDGGSSVISGSYNVKIQRHYSNPDQAVYTIRKEKFPLNLAVKYNEDNWEFGFTGLNSGNGHQSDDEYFLQNTQAAGISSGGVDQTGAKYNRYYKIRNVDTGEQLISGQCTGSSENTGSNAAIITDVVNALKAGVAHTGMNTSSSESGQSTSNWPQANGTRLSTSKAYADMPFTLEADETNTQIILTYKTLVQSSHATAGKWILSRCNSPTPTQIPTTGGSTHSLGNTTHGAGNSSNHNSAGMDRLNQYVNAAPDSEYKLLTDTAVNKDANKGTDLYFRLTTTGQSVAVNTDPISYKCRYTTTYDLFHGGSAWTKGDTFTIVMKTGSTYQVTIEEISTSKVQANRGLIRPRPTSFDTKTVVTAESILGDLRTGIDADHNSNFNEHTDGRLNSAGTYVSGVKQVGNGLHITRSSGTFNITTPSPALLNVFTNEIQDIGDLPSQCVDGFRVKIRNSEANEDDYYVRFIADNGRDGTGVWEECPEPGRKVMFDKDTMPIQLVRNADGTFTLDEIDWQICIAGNTVTVPEPSFIGKNITKMMFWRNRMLLLSDENVIMSQPGEYFNYWPKSSITYTASDVIDISVSSEFPAIIYDGALTNSGLILFSKNQQYLLTTDSDVLSPQTAKINTISTYNFNSNTNPISLGTTTAFLDNAGKFSRLWEMANVLREGEPIVIDQTKVVSKLFAKDLELISNSRENSIIFFSQKNNSTLYGYKYFNTSEKRLQQSWFTWELPGAIQHHAVLDDALYIVLRNNSKDTLQKIAIKMDDGTFTAVDDKDTTDTLDDVTYRVHLDTAKEVAIGNVYNSGTNKTTFSKPDGFESPTAQLVVYNNNPDSFDIGSYALATVNGSNIEITGDWGNQSKVVLGYNYDMEIKLPTIYYTQQTGDNVIIDTNSSLVIHRLKLNFGGSGSYVTTLDRAGKASTNYTESREAPLSDEYNSDQLAVNASITQTVPVYERNKNFNLIIKSTHPTPATLHSMSWEGDYTTNYYKRV